MLQRKAMNVTATNLNVIGSKASSRLPWHRTWRNSTKCWHKKTRPLQQMKWPLYCLSLHHKPSGENRMYRGRPLPPVGLLRGKRWLAQFLSASSATRSLATLTRFHSRIEHTMRAAMLSIWTLYGTSQRHQRQKCTECPCNFYLKKTNKKTKKLLWWLSDYNAVPFNTVLHF